MKQVKAYRYIGRNGIITSRILLNNIDYIPMMELIADQGKILTNGNTTAKWITVEFDEVNDWEEIADENS